MKPLELIRIIALTVFGIILVLLIQPWLYRSDIISLDVLDVEQWIVTDYLPSSYWVLGASIAATVIWYFSAANAKPLTAKDTSSWRLLWWIFLLIPIVGIGFALYLQTEPSTRVGLAAMYVVDVLVLYWLPTASSSPSHTKYLPPLSMNLRRLVEPGS